MNECKEISTPLMQNEKLSNNDESNEVDGTLYQQLVGSLNYLTKTRPKIAYSVCMLTQFMDKPRETHWLATKRALLFERNLQLWN